MSRHVFACAACGKIVRGKRPHAITCGAACRVRLYRQPELRTRLESDSRSMGLSVAGLLERRALAALHPDLAERLESNEISIEAARSEAFHRLLRDLRSKQRTSAS